MKLIKVDVFTKRGETEADQKQDMPISHTRIKNQKVCSVCMCVQCLFKIRVKESEKKNKIGMEK